MNGKEFRSMSKYQKYQRKKESEEEKRMFEEGYEYMDRLAAQQESQRFSPSIQELTDKKSFSELDNKQMEAMQQNLRACHW